MCCFQICCDLLVSHIMAGQPLTCQFVAKGLFVQNRSLASLLHSAMSFADIHHPRSIAYLCYYIRLTTQYHQSKVYSSLSNYQHVTAKQLATLEALASNVLLLKNPILCRHCRVFLRWCGISLLTQPVSIELLVVVWQVYHQLLKVNS